MIHPLSRTSEGPGHIQWPGPQHSLLVATLVARLAQQLAVLLLRHALAALLDNGAHGVPPS